MGAQANGVTLLTRGPRARTQKPLQPGCCSPRAKVPQAGLVSNQCPWSFKVKFNLLPQPTRTGGYNVRCAYSRELSFLISFPSRVLNVLVYFSGTTVSSALESPSFPI